MGCDLEGRGQQSGEQLLSQQPPGRQIWHQLGPASAAKSISHDPVPARYVRAHSSRVVLTTTHSGLILLLHLSLKCDAGSGGWRLSHRR